MRPRYSIAAFAWLALCFPAAQAAAAPGDIDNSFNGGVPAVIDDNPAYSLIPRAAAVNPLNGDILWTGYISGGGLVSGLIFAYGPDGTVDTSVVGGFGIVLDPGDAGIPGGLLQFFAGAVDVQGRILAVGEASDSGDTTFEMVLARFNPDGTPDTTFGAAGTGVVTDALNNVAIGTGLSLTADGHILVTGEAFDPGGTQSELTVWRFGPDGTPDAGFGDGGHVQVAGLSSPVPETCFPALQPDGALLVGCIRGYAGAPWIVTRLNADGSVDDAFGSSGFIAGAPGLVLAGLALAPDGGFVVGEYDQFTLPHPIDMRRFLADGTVDDAFNGGNPLDLGVLSGPGNLLPLAVQPDGKILFGVNIDNYLGILRLLADGTYDLDFGNGIAGLSAIDFDNIGGNNYTPVAAALVLQGDGKIVASGHADSSLGADQAAFVTRVDGDDFVFTPDPFSFTDQNGVTRGVTVTSNAITVSGLTDGVVVPVSVTGGEYRIGGGDWTGEPGYAGNGDQIAVRHTSSDSYATQTTTTLTVGGVVAPNNLSIVLGMPASADFTSTTEAAPPPSGGGGGGSSGGGSMGVLALGSLLLLALVFRRLLHRKAPAPSGSAQRHL